MLQKRETFKDDLLHHRDLRQKRDVRKKKEEIKLDAKIVKEASKALGNTLNPSRVITNNTLLLLY